MKISNFFLATALVAISHTSLAQNISFAGYSGSSIDGFSLNDFTPSNGLPLATGYGIDYSGWDPGATFAEATGTPAVWLGQIAPEGNQGTITSATPFILNSITLDLSSSYSPLGSVVTISEGGNGPSFNTYLQGVGGTPAPYAYQTITAPPGATSPTTSVLLTDTPFGLFTGPLNNAYVDNPDGTTSIFDENGNLVIGENVTCPFTGAFCGTANPIDGAPFSLVSMDVTFVGSPAATPLPPSDWLMLSALGIVFLYLRQPQQPRNKTIA